MTKSKGLKRTALAALIPGTKFDPTTFEVTGVSDPEAPTVVFNLRGTIFETYRSNLYRKNLSNLSDSDFLNQFYRKKFNDYFFDRDPSLFSSILEYQRTGMLHVPVNVCGKLAKQELEFWGINECRIEKCCWNTFDSWNSTYDSLNQLEEAQKKTHVEYDPQRIETEKYGRIKSIIWNFLTNHRSSKGAQIYGMTAVAFILLSVISFITATHPACRIEGTRDFLGRLHRNTTMDLDLPVTVPHPALIIIDLICVVFFTCELTFRFISSPNRKTFLTNFLNIVDLTSLLPDYVDLIVGYTTNIELATEVMNYANFLRIARAFRIFRLIRYVPGLWILFYTFKASFCELLLMVGFMVVGMIVFATLIFYTGERSFSNIPIGLWWALITMTTVGYGDMYPESSWGYLVGSLCAITGLLMVGFTVPIIVNHFVMYYTHMRSMRAAKRREKIIQKEMKELRNLIEAKPNGNNSISRGGKEIAESSPKPKATVATTKVDLDQPVQTILSNSPPPSYEGIANSDSHRRLRAGLTQSLTPRKNNGLVTNGQYRLKDDFKRDYNSISHKNRRDVLELDNTFHEDENQQFVYGQNINDMPSSAL